MKIMYISNAKSIVFTCVNCGLVDHYNKNYYKCSKYNPDTADSGKFV
jgi:predicted nucleic-acid-binding Zn-ribbon protein